MSKPLEVGGGGGGGGGGSKWPIRGYNYADLSSDCIPELLAFRDTEGGVLDLWSWQVRTGTA